MARYREVRSVFLEVFGPRDARTKHGGFILQVLQEKFGKGLPPNAVSNDGMTDALLTMRKLGHFDVIEAINNAIEWREPDAHRSGST